MAQIKKPSECQAFNPKQTKKICQLQQILNLSNKLLIGQIYILLINYQIVFCLNAFFYPNQKKAQRMPGPL